MTSRSKNAVRSYETEIEKCREESNWKKAVELATQLKARSPQHESLAHFLIGEGKLEAHLEEWPPIRDNIERAQRELSDARGYLTLATDEAGKKAGVALDAHLLLGKLNYACGAYDDALKNYKLAELNTLTEKELPIRSLRIVAESYAIKGLCLEETAPGGGGASSRFKAAEREADMVRSFELASDLTLLYLQKTAAPAVRAGPTLEAALQRAPHLHLKAGRPQAAIDRYRSMLRATECQWTQALRLTLARQLAELLMRGTNGQEYKIPSVSTAGGRQAAPGPWTPAKYTSINQFVPQNVYEEIVLLLLVSEAMAVRAAVLSQSAEFEVERGSSLRAARAVGDLLALAAARWGHLQLVLESLERAMKFSFGCGHTWRQRALATAAAAAATPPSTQQAGSPAWTAGTKAVSVMRHAKTLATDDAPLRLVGANTCYNMGELEEGIALAEEALAIEQKTNGPLLARCHLYTGIGYQMKAQRTNSRIEKEASNEKSLQNLLKAVQLDNNDHLAFYHLALHYLRQAMLNEAMDAARCCLHARAECAGGLRVAAALWACGAAGARGGRALAAAAVARHHYPAAPWPLTAAAMLQLQWGEPDAALASARELLALLNSSTESEMEQNGYTELDALSDSQPEDVQSNRDAVSLRAESVGVYRVERALSEAAQSGAPCSKLLAGRRAQAWLLCAELCLRLGRITAAAGCVAEAAALTPYSHLVLYTRGLVHEASAEWEEARACFRDAVAIHPTHLDSLVHLGTAYYETGWIRLAESVLRSALALQPLRGDTWRRLSLVLSARGEHAAAADAAAAAVCAQPAAVYSHWGL
ncbi:hypothetical protein JYU34_017778 [Plutella xylostella]|uniref:Tetratricopeptide repeat protein 7 N-terminal domain-containing protein n=1 Tax=Plutella xylostella TaxID=51655 RepID=A0ABQ7Q3B7_PLUXY|nr:hypothetical protein JYU34_017778 [Plutella xylostella]